MVPGRSGALCFLLPRETECIFSALHPQECQRLVCDCIRRNAAGTIYGPVSMVNCSQANVTDSAFFNNFLWPILPIISNDNSSPNILNGGGGALAVVGYNDFSTCFITGNSFRGKHTCGCMSCLVMWTVHALFGGISHPLAWSCA
jgi:hypothetical protein